MNIVSQNMKTALIYIINKGKNKICTLKSKNLSTNQFNFNFCYKHEELKENIDELEMLMVKVEYIQYINT